MVREPGLSLKHILKRQNAIHFGPSPVNNHWRLVLNYNSFIDYIVRLTI